MLTRGCKHPSTTKKCAPSPPSAAAVCSVAGCCCCTPTKNNMNMSTPSSALPPGSAAGTSRRQSAGSEGGKGEVEAHGVDHWTLVGEKLTAEKRLAEDAKKVLVTDINTSLRRLVDDINEDNWMYNPVDVGYSTGQQSR